MLIHSFANPELGNFSYLVASEQEKVCVLIDPVRTVDEYLKLANERGFTITHVLETHIHADFISGAREIAAKVQAKIAASAEAKLGFPHLPLSEGNAITAGSLKIKVLTTPGHTPEHISFTLFRKDDLTAQALFSGGALSFGGAARTDLISPDLTIPLARSLYHTLHDKLLKLPDAVTVYPTHGGGSFCSSVEGSGATSTTIAHERLVNFLCQAKTENDFVRRALENLSSYPGYFKMLRPINQRGPELLQNLPPMKSMSPKEVTAFLEKGGTVLDIRKPKDFAAAHIKGSYGIGLTGSLATWTGWIIPFGTRLVLVTPESENDVKSAASKLHQIGYDDLYGYLEGGFSSWKNAGYPCEQFPVISVDELNKKLNSINPPTVLDVRQDSEWKAGHIPKSLHIENGQLPIAPPKLPKDQPVAVHCASMNRSTTGVSILSRLGYQNLMLVESGFNGWKNAGYEIELEKLNVVGPH